MKHKTLLTLFHLTTALGAAQIARAQTAFTYQGKLVDDCCPATGLYDLKFRLFDAATTGSRIPTGSFEFTANAVPVTNGLFTVPLDFGSSGFDGSRRWLELDVRTNNSPGGYATLSPRTELTATPYAIRALSASMMPSNSITAPNISAGQVVKSLNGLKDNINLVAGPNVTLRSNGNDLQISATGGLTLPYSGSASSSSALLSLNNTGTGPAVSGNTTTGVGVAGSAGTGTAVFGQANSSGGFGGLFRYGADGNNSAYLGLSSVAADFYGTVICNGNVGIRTPNPAYNLDVNGRVMARGGFLAPWGPILTVPVGPNTNLVTMRWDGYNGDRVDLEVPGATANNALFSFTANNKLGIGTSRPGGKLHVFGNSAPGANIPSSTTVLASGDGFNNRFMSVHGNNAAYLSMWHGGYGELSTFDYSTGRGLPLVLNANGGTVSVPTLEIRGGADLAEPFQMSEEMILEGSVVVIDEENPGHLKRATSAYDTRVAGIVSGANGVKAGIALHQEGVLEGGQNVALTGRVFVKADASVGAIKPGDLLTTSDTPGHAMKVIDATKAQGAILGKAMTALKEGKGMVLVLVSLQ